MIRNRLQQYLTESGRGRTDVAGSLCIPREQLDELCEGRRLPDLLEAVGLVALLDVPRERLWPGADLARGFRVAQSPPTGAQ